MRSRPTGLRALLATRGEGLQALAFATGDAAACSTALRARGLRATPPQDGEAHTDGGGMRSYRTVELSPRATRGLSVFAVERADDPSLHAGTAADAAVVALDHVVVRTADPDAAIALYRDALGIRLALDRSARRAAHAVLPHRRRHARGVQDPAVGANDAFYGAAYRVRDLDAAHARLQAQGFALSEVREGNKPGTRVFTVRDGTCGVPTLILRDPSRD